MSIEAVEARHDVEVILARLTPRQRQVVVARHLGDTRAEIAASLDVSPGRVWQIEREVQHTASRIAAGARLVFGQRRKAPAIVALPRRERSAAADVARRLALEREEQKWLADEPRREAARVAEERRQQDHRLMCELVVAWETHGNDATRIQRPFERALPVMRRVMPAHIIESLAYRMGVQLK